MSIGNTELVNEAKDNEANLELKNKHGRSEDKFGKYHQFNEISSVFMIKIACEFLNHTKYNELYIDFF